MTYWKHPIIDKFIKYEWIFYDTCEYWYRKWGGNCRTMPCVTVLELWHHSILWAGPTRVLSVRLLQGPVLPWKPESPTSQCNRPKCRQVVSCLLMICLLICCFTSSWTKNESYMWRHIDVQADWIQCMTKGGFCHKISNLFSLLD